MSIRAWIWSAVAGGSGGPPQVRRSSAWMTPCGWPVRWLQAPTRPLSSLRSAARAWRLTGGAAGAVGAFGPVSVGGGSGGGFGGSGSGGDLGALPLAQQVPDLVGVEQAGQAEVVLFLRGACRRRGA